MADRFDLESFLPFRLHHASETASNAFRQIYRNEHGMTRSEWRVLAHLGQFGEMTATEIGAAAGLHKTKVSRAVASLEKRRWLGRTTNADDKRVKKLTLTSQGEAVFARLGKYAIDHNEALKRELGPGAHEALLQLLKKIEAMG